MLYGVKLGYQTYLVLELIVTPEYRVQLTLALSLTPIQLVSPKLIILSTSQPCIQSQAGTYALSSWILSNEFEVLVVCGELGAPAAVAVELLASLGKPVFAVCTADDNSFPREDWLAHLRALAQGTSVEFLDRSSARYAGVNFLGIQYVDSVAQDRSWLMHQIAGLQSVPTVVITVGNPLLSDHHDFFSGKRAPLLALLDRAPQTLSLYAWIHANSPLASITLHPQGIAAVACSGYLTRLAFGAPLKPFSLFHIRQQLQLSKVEHQLTALRLAQHINSSMTGEYDFATLHTLSTVDALISFVREAPFLTEQAYQLAESAAAFAAEGSFPECWDVLQRFHSMEPEALVLDVELAFAHRKLALNVLTAVTRSEGLTFEVVTARDAEERALDTCSLHIEVSMPADPSGGDARYLESLKSAVEHVWDQYIATRFTDSKAVQRPLSLHLTFKRYE